MSWFSFAWRNLGRNRRRSLATLLLVAMGVCGILSTSGFALYTYESLKEFAMRENGQLILSHDQFFTEDEEFPLQYGMDNWRDTRAALLSDPRVQFVLPSIQFNGLISNGNKSTIFMGKGVDAQLPKVMGPALVMKTGRFLSLRPDEAADDEIILGSKLAASLDADIGTGLTLLASTADGALNAIDVQVVGVVSTGIPEMDARLVMVHNQTAQVLVDSERVSQLSIYLQQSKLQNLFAGELEAKYSDLQVTPWQDRAFFYRSVRNLYDRIFGVMGGVILIMVLFAVFNTSAMSVMERIGEIGTLGALGTFRGEIVRLLAIESAQLSFVGALFGMLLSAAITLLLRVIPINMPAPPGQSEGYPLQIYFSMEVALFSLVLVIFIAVLASLIASRKGVNLTIGEALRHA